MKALLVDWGGVLTTSIPGAFRDFAVAEGLHPDAIRQLIVGDRGARAELHALETGQMAEPEWERRWSGRLGVHAEGLLGRIFATLDLDREMVETVRAARAAGVCTALVSNSWGMAIYDRALIGELFDEVVISAEVGLRKPDAAIFRLTLERLAVEPGSAVMVDDLTWNVAAAEELGMVGVLHAGAAQTIAQLERLLGRALRG